MAEYINGPVNYVELKGSINGINKTIHIFMDKHYRLDEQTRCESFNSIEISYYLYKQIKEAKEPLDFFMEIRNDSINKKKSQKKDIYINEVVELFKSEFVIENDKVLYAKSNKNVRLHYLDIRDYFDLFYLTDLLIYEIVKDFNLFVKGDLKDTSIIKNNLDIIEKYIKKVFNLKEQIIENKINITTKKSSEYYLDKIINKYSNNDIKLNLNYFLNIEFMDYYIKFFRLLGKIKLGLNNLETYKTNILIDDIIMSFVKLNDIIVDIYSLFTDVYLLRRILEKDYIQNIITYSGRQHSLNYIYFLVKLCNFKVINAQISSEKDLDSLNDKIKNSDQMNEVYNLFLMNDEKPKQCVEYVKYDREFNFLDK